MKACILLQNQYAKLGHAIACDFKERHGVTNFSTFVISLGAAEFIREQKDIDYNTILVDHELHKKHTDVILDLEFIKKFEEEYSMPPLWHYLYADRKLMMSIGPKEETTTTIDPLYSHEDLLRSFQVRARAIEDMLKKEMPDFIVFFAIGALGHMILHHVAKKLGIRTFGIDFPRVANLVCLSESYNTLTGVEKTFKRFVVNPNDEELKKADDFIKHYRNTGSLRLEYYETFMKNFLKKKSLLHPKNAIRSFKYLFTLTGNYWRNRKLFVYGETSQSPFRFIAHKFKRRYRVFRGVRDMVSKPDYSTDYVFFPLHYEPELALILLAPYYFDQAQLIAQIARSLPIQYKLYVKDHPAMKGRRARSYYKSLLKIPNVVIIDPSVSSFDLIKGSKLITTITGTVGWEASMLGKPVITFGNVFYNVLSFVKQVGKIEDLPNLVNSQLNNFSYNFDEMKRLVAAVFADSFALDFFGLWVENDISKLRKDSGVHEFTNQIIKRMKE